VPICIQTFWLITYVFIALSMRRVPRRMTIAILIPIVASCGQYASDFAGHDRSLVEEGVGVGPSVSIRVRGRDGQGLFPVTRLYTLRCTASVSPWMWRVQ
jgi:hypothetical protein